MIIDNNLKTQVLNALDKSDLRLVLSHFYLQGTGIEIGALHLPLPLPPKAIAQYVDRMNVADLRIHYPEYKELPVVEVDYIDNGEELLTVENESQDFIIANHFFEHCVNPLKTLKTFLSKLKAGGIIFMAIPDKRFCFDRYRDLTTFDHILDDYLGRNDHFLHYIEWARLVNHVSDEDEILKQANNLLETQYSIHFHVWDHSSFIDFLLKTSKFFNHKFEVLNVSFSDHREEIITILRKK